MVDERRGSRDGQAPPRQQVPAGPAGPSRDRLFALVSLGARSSARPVGEAGRTVIDQGLVARITQSPPARILVVQTAYLGDTVFTSALVAGLAARFSGTPVDLCVSPRGRDVARAMPGVAEVYVYDKRGLDAGAPGLLRLARLLRERGHGLAVLPHGSLRTALLAHAAEIPERLGFRNAASRLLCTATVPDPGGPFVEREAALLAALGALPGPMRLSLRDADRLAAAVRLAELGLRDRRLAGLAIGSEWETKIWPEQHFAALARGFARRGLVPLLLGGPRDQQRAARIARASEVVCADTTGNPVAEALALIERCEVLVGGDSGLLHAARALGVPTVPLFGPTDPQLHRFGRNDRPLWLALPCAPCSSHGTRRCPLEHHNCLVDLSPERVLAAAASLVGLPAGAPLA